MKEFKINSKPKITTGFLTPDNYFETVSERILGQFPKQEPKSISVFSIRKTWYYVAAMLILILSVPLYTKYLNHQEEKIDSATLENYLAYQSNISEDEIVNLLEPEDLDKIKMEFHVDDAAIEDVLKSNSNLEQYIID